MSSLVGFLIANGFLLAIVLIGALILWGFGALMWWANLPPDDHPALTMLAALLAVGGTWWLAALAHRWIDQRLRRAR